MYVKAFKTDIVFISNIINASQHTDRAILECQYENLESFMNLRPCHFLFLSDLLLCLSFLFVLLSSLCSKFFYFNFNVVITFVFWILNKMIGNLVIFPVISPSDIVSIINEQLDQCLNHNLPHFRQTHWLLHHGPGKKGQWILYFIF
jgi:hypothetical protein